MRVAESFSVKVDRKLFSFKGLAGGSKVEIVEVSRSRSSRVILNLGVVAWVKDSLSSLTYLGAKDSFFRRWKSPGSLFWLQKVTNSMGTCVVLASEASNGLRTSLFVPEGRRAGGWKLFVEALSRCLSKDFGGGGLSAISIIAPPPSILGSYVEAVQGKSTSKLLPCREREVEIDFAFETSSCVLVVKERALDSWPSIERGIRLRFGGEIKLHPFCDNLAVIHVLEVSLKSKLVSFGRSSLLGCAIHLRTWDDGVVAESRSISFAGGWVDFVDIPPHLRTLGVVRGLASMCGGLSGEISEVSLSSGVEEVRCRVVGNVNGFIPVGCFLNQGAVAFWVRLLR